MKKPPSALSIAFVLSLTTSIGIVAYRAKSGAAGGKQAPDIEFVSDGGASKGIPVSKAWQVLVFKNYECPACRQRVPEFETFRREHLGKVQVRFFTYILPRFELAMPAARVAEASKLLGKQDEVENVLLSGATLTKETIARANSLISSQITPAIEQKVKAEIANQAITAAKFQFEGIPAIFAISPDGGIYKVTHAGVIDELMANENSHRPEALRLK